MSRSSIVLLLFLVGCGQPQETTTPEEKQAITKLKEIEAYHTPTPVPASKWVQIQTERWNKAQIRPEKLHFVLALSSSIQRNKTRYATVQEATNGVPWTVIGSIHNMECSQSFREHLHNGDPITVKTRHVPAGRPNPWLPPYDWESSAIDAIKYDKLNQKNWRDIGNELQNVESFNGLGYQKRGVISPYLWSWTSLYSRGKFISDGVYSDTAISQQCGVAPILKSLQ